MTFNEVREIGLKFPRAEEARYYRMPALKVDGEVFVVKTSHPSAEPHSVSVPVGFERRDKLIAANPKTFYLKPHYKPYPVVLVRLDRINRSDLKQLLLSAHEAVSSGVVVPGRRQLPLKK